MIILGACIFGAGILSGVILTRYVIGLTSKLIRKSKIDESLDEDFKYDNQNEETL